MEDQQHIPLSIHDPLMFVPILRQPSISHDQQTIAALQQTSKPLQAAIRELLAGQLPVVLHTNQLRQAQALAKWLAKHAGLLRSLELQLPCRCHATGLRSWPAGTATALAAALQQAAAAGPILLQSFTLKGTEAGAGLLQQLPPAHLRQLHAPVDYSSAAALQAVAGLTNLRQLNLTSTPAAAATVATAWMPSDALAPLAASLQQLTELHIGPVTPAQLQLLPPQLQLLHVTVDLCNTPQQLLELASWLEQQQHAGLLRTLELVDGPNNRLEPGWDAAADAMAAAFEAAAAAADGAAAAAAATGMAARSAAGLQLQSFSGCNLAGPVLQHLPAASLTALTSQLDWGTAPHVAALCNLTSLRKLELTSAHGYTCWHGLNVLAPLSALQQLQSLHIDVLQRRQLRHLQLPQLQELDMMLEICTPPSECVPMQLGHLTSLSSLRLTDYAASLCSGDVFPPKLQELELVVIGEEICCLWSLQRLSQLRKLHVSFRGVPQRSEEAVGQLSRLTSLQELSLSYRWKRQLEGLAEDTPWLEASYVALEQAVDAVKYWQQLPIKSLAWSCMGLPAAVMGHMGALSALTSLTLCIRQFSTGCHHNEPTPKQLAGMLRQLKSLRPLDLSFWRAGLGGRQRLDDAYDVAALLKAVGGLKKLEEASVVLPVSRDVSGELQQLLPGLGCDHLLPYCKVAADEVSVQL